MVTGVCHSAAGRDEPGGSGVVWRGWRVGQGPQRGQGVVRALLGWWSCCGGPKSAAAGCPRHGAVGGVCGECVAF